MGMSFGMIGALGGIGSALTAQGDFLRKQEEAEAEDKRLRGREEWRMRTQEEFSIRAEGRQEQSAIRTDARNWENEQTRAPKKAEMAADGEIIKARKSLEFKEQNGDRLTKVKQAETDAGETTSTKNKNNATADYYSGAKTEAELARAAARSGGGDGTKPDKERIDYYKESLKSAREELKELLAAPPSPKDAAAVQEHKRLVTTARERIRKIDADWQSALGGRAGGGGSDVFNVRGKELPAQQGMVGSFDGDPAAISEAIAGIKDPQERANARAAFEEQMNRGKDGKLGQRAPLPGGKAATVKADVEAAPTPTKTSAPRPAFDPMNGNRGNETADTRADPLATARDNARRGLLEEMGKPDFDPAMKPELLQPDEARELRAAEGERRNAFVRGVDEKPFEDKVKTLRQRITERMRRDYATK